LRKVVSIEVDEIGCDYLEWCLWVDVFGEECVDEYCEGV